MKLYHRIVAYYRPFLPKICVALALLLLTIGINLLKPWPIKWLIDHVLPLGQAGRVATAIGEWNVPEAIAVGALVYVAAFLFHGLFNVLNNYLLIEIGLRALLRLRTEIYACLQYLPLHFHDRRRSGDSTFRVAYDTQAIQTFFNRGFVSILGSVLTLVGTFGVMFAMQPKLALMALGVMPFLWLSIHAFADRIRTQSTTLQEEESDLLARAQEGLSSIRIVHAFGREEFEIREFESEARQSLVANLKLSFTNVLSGLVVGVITAIGTAGVLYFGAQEVLAGNMKIGDLWVFLSYLAALYIPLEQLSYTAWAMEGAAAGMQRVFEILDQQDTVPDRPDAKKLKAVEGRLEVREVHFSYEPNEPILRNVSFKVESGKTVALVGGTGAGKTSLLSLVPRFYDPTYGSVLLDGVDIREYTKNSLREKIAIVLQDTLLLSGTIEENIAYGRPGAKRSEIQAAAEAAQAHDFISKLPKGYQTTVGERGVRLSGGQRQRIGIARAFLKNAPLLLLDEPTSALDLETEAEIMETLQSLVKRQTTIIVTHRLTTIHQLADEIIVLENGSVAERGRGVDLVSQNGLYARLWKAGMGELK